MWIKVAGFILRYRILLLFLLLAGTAFMGYMATKLEMSYEHGRLIPSDDPDYVAYQAFKETFGQDGNVLVIGIESNEIFDIEFFNDWYQLTKEVRSKPGVEDVLSIANMPKLVKNVPARKFEVVSVVDQIPKSQNELDSLKKEILNNKLFDGLLYNEERSSTLIAVNIDPAALNSERRIEVVEGIRDAVLLFGENHNEEIHFSGLPYTRTIFATKVRKELELFSLLAILVTGLLLWVFFRSVSAVIFPMVVVMIGAVCSMGTIVLFDYRVTILSGLIPPLIVVIGIPNCVYLLNKFHAEFRKHGNKIKALSRIIEKIGIATFITNATTAIGFGVFAFTGSKILLEFGIVASLNIMFVFIVSIIVIPTVFSILPAPKAGHVKHLENKLIYKLLRVFEYLVSEKRKAVFITTGILVIAAGIGLTRLEAVGYILDDIPKEDKLYTDLVFFQDHFKGVMPLAVLIDTGKKGGAQKISNLRKIERAEALFAEHDFFSKPVSVVGLMKAANQAYYNGNPKHYRLPNNQESRFVVPYAVRTANREAGVNMTLTDSTRRVVRIALNMADVGTKVMKATFDDIKPRVDSIFAGDENVTVTYTGKSPVFLKGNQYLIDSLIFSLVLAFIFISFIMAALFKSLRIIFISFATNAIPLLITAAAMGYLGIYLKPSTVLIFSIAFGISVDDSIHFLTKYRQELKWHSWDMKKTVLTALDETGTSMIYTSVILFFGFIIFAASNFQGTVALGMLTSVTLIVAMLANLVLLPSLIIELDSRSKKQIGHRLR